MHHVHDRPIIHHDAFAESLFVPGSILCKYRLYGPVDRPPPERTSPPQRKLPDFDHMRLPPLIPSNWIDGDASHRRLGSTSPDAADRGLPGPSDRVIPQPPTPPPPPPPPSTHGRHRHHPHRPRHASQRSRNGATRTRRRGNLPKFVTERLRGWFYNHIGHPYPTEDEKQQLMRQTGMQLAQISNWFINARRRKLPKLNQEAEAEARLRTQLGPPCTLPYRPVPLEGPARGITDANLPVRGAKPDAVHPPRPQ